MRPRYRWRTLSPRCCERGWIARLEWSRQLAFQSGGDLVELDHFGGLTDRNSLGLTHPVKTLEEYEKFLVREISYPDRRWRSPGAG